MDDKSNILLYIQIVVLLGSFICTGALIRKAINFHARLGIGLGVFAACTIAFIYLGISVPLTLLSETTRIQSNLTVDVMMYSAIGLISIGIICFAIDHVFEIPTCLMIAAAAILSIGLAPFFYRMRQDSFNESYKINVVAPEPPRETLPSPKPQSWLK